MPHPIRRYGLAGSGKTVSGALPFNAFSKHCAASVSNRDASNGAEGVSMSDTVTVAPKFRGVSTAKNPRKTASSPAPHVRPARRCERAARTPPGHSPKGELGRERRRRGCRLRTVSRECSAGYVSGVATPRQAIQQTVDFLQLLRRYRADKSAQSVPVHGANLKNESHGFGS